jgi:hypothetical protein
MATVLLSVQFVGTVAMLAAALYTWKNSKAD